MTRNLPSLRSIAADPSVARDLPLDAIDALLSEAAAETTIVAAAKKALNGELERRYGSTITAAFSAKGADFGTVHVTDGVFDLEVNVPKKVEWDQGQLQAIGDRIAEAGDKPHEYITTELKVDERKFTAWPEHIRAIFEPARTLKPGSMTIKLSMKKAA